MSRKIELVALSKIGGAPDVVTMIPLEDIDLSPIYQRDHVNFSAAARSHIVQMVRNWDDRIMDPIKACKAQGGLPHKYNVVDGGWRIVAHERMNRTHIKAVVVFSAGEEDEAAMFKSKAEGVRAIAIFDKYNAGVVAGDTKYTDVKIIVEKAGYYVARSSGQNHFTAISTLISLIKTNKIMASRAMEIAGLICDPGCISGRLLRGLFVMLLEPRGVTGPDVIKLRRLGRLRLQAAIETEAYNAPKAAASGRVAANGIRRAMRSRQKTG